MRDWLFLVVACWAVFLVACSNPQPVEERIEFGVEVLSPTDKQVIIESNTPAIDQAQGGEVYRDTLQLDSNHWAKLETPSWPAGLYTLHYGERSWQVYLKPGKTLYAQIDGSDPTKPIEFQGRLKKVANYLQERNDVVERLRQDVRPAYGSKEEAFLAFVDSSRKVLDSMLVQFTTNNTRFDMEFMRRQGLSNYYIIAQWLENYPSYRAYYAAEEDTLLPISEVYKEKREKFSLNDSSAIVVDEYLEYLQDVVYNKVTAFYNSHLDSLQNQRYVYYELGVQTADTLVALPIIKDYLFYRQLSDMIQFDGPSINDSLYRWVNNRMDHPAFTEQLMHELDQWKSLMRGEPAPDFSAITASGDTVRLSDLEGKLVYLDVWATWCGPCKEEIPLIKELQRKFRYLPVEIVSISIDNSRSAWEYALENDGLRGNQWWVENAWQSELAKHYKIGGIPRFILLDQKGKLIDANAPRPSMGGAAFIQKWLRKTEA